MTLRYNQLTEGRMLAYTEEEKQRLLKQLRNWYHDYRGGKGNFKVIQFAFENEGKISVDDLRGIRPELQNPSGNLSKFVNFAEKSYGRIFERIGPGLYEMIPEFRDLLIDWAKNKEKKAILSEINLSRNIFTEEFRKAFDKCLKVAERALLNEISDLVCKKLNMSYEEFENAFQEAVKKNLLSIQTIKGRNGIYVRFTE